MNDTNQLVLGDLLATEAIQRTASHNQEFVESAFGNISMLASTGKPFTADDVWHETWFPECTDNRALGAAFRKASQAKLIRAIGWTKCKRASRHGTDVRVWEGVKK